MVNHAEESEPYRDRYEESVLKHHTCEMYLQCGYTTDAANFNTLARHLRQAHGRSSRDCADLEEFIAEGFIVEADIRDMLRGNMIG